MGYNGYLKFSQQSLLYSHSVTLPEMKKKKKKMQKLKPVQRLITLILLVGKNNVSQKKGLAFKTLRPRVAKSFLLQAF